VSEVAEHEKLALLLSRHIDPETTWWTSLENKPRSRVSGASQRRRNVRAGIPDVMVVYRGRLIFIELKSRSGIPSKAQRQVRTELLKTGAGTWWLARSAHAAMVAALCSASHGRRRSLRCGKVRSLAQRGNCRRHRRRRHRGEPLSSDGVHVNAIARQRWRPGHELNLIFRHR
jgi:hypothetical protein